MTPPLPPESETDPMQSWLASKRALRPSHPLADSIMAALNEPALGASSVTRVPHRRPAWWRALWNTAWARAAVLLLAAVGGVGRVVLVLIWLLRNQPYVQ